MTNTSYKIAFESSRVASKLRFSTSILTILTCASFLGASPSSAAPDAGYLMADGSHTLDLSAAVASWKNDAEFNGNWGLAAIKAEAAYAWGYTGLNSVIGVIDQPVWEYHPEFVDPVDGQKKVQFITTRGTYVYEDPYMKNRKLGVEFVYDGSIYVDGRGEVATHGTHVAGIAAGNRSTTSQTDGVMQGVAFNARLIAADNGDPGPEDGIVKGNDGNAYRAAFQAMIDNNVDIITNSWGIGVKGATWTYADAASQFQEVEKLLGTVEGGAYDGAIDAARKGIVLEFSAGNDEGKDPDALAGLAAFIPELESHWITTMSVQQDLTRSGFSSVCGYTKYFCVAAPGSSIYSAIVDGDIAGKSPGDTVDNLTAEYKHFDGTSMAGPFVTGAFGVLTERFSYLTNADINTILKTTSTDLGEEGVDDVYGWGLINLEQALKGPGELMGRMNAVLGDGLSDTWSNDISQDALNQRKKEERVEIANWSARKEELESKLVDLAPLGPPSEELIAEVTEVLEKLDDLLKANVSVGYDNNIFMTALNSLRAHRLGPALISLYGEVVGRDNWFNYYSSKDAYDAFIDGTQIEDIASKLDNPAFYKALREDNARRLELAMGEKRVALLNEKDDGDYVGSLAKLGDGTLHLSGANTYEGTTHVRGGTLVVDGSIQGDALVDGSGKGLEVVNSTTGDKEISKLGGQLIVNGNAGKVTLDAGGLLGGSGALGTLIANNGGIVSPGNSIGTLTVSKANGDGSVTFEKGSTFGIEIASDGTSDRLVAEGVARLNGGAVTVRAQDGEADFDVVKNAADHSVTYSILEAADGVNGAFDNVQTGYALFRGSLDYSAQEVMLGITQSGFEALGTSFNQKQTAQGLDSSGTDNAIYNEVLRTPEGQNIAPLFDALSGEIYASTKGYLLTSSSHLTGAATERLRSGLGLETSQAGSSSNIWGQAFGSWGKVDSDGNASGYKSNISGVLTGIDGSPNDKWQAGVLFGYSQSDVKSGLASSDVDSFYVGLYGATDINDFALRLGANYSHHEISTNRSVFDRAKLNADYRADSVLTSAELAYQSTIGTAKIEPFANVAFNYVATGSMREDGSSDYALTGASGSESLWVTGLGLRASEEITLGNETKLRLNGSAVWRYAAGDVTPSSRLSFNGGQAFENLGSPIARNTAALTAGIGLDLTASASLNVDYIGEFSSNTRNHGVKALLNVKF